MKKTNVRRLLDANRRYIESGVFSGDISSERRQSNAHGQKPYAVIITCSDSRVLPEAIYNAGIGELFVVRTAGNTIADSEFASVEYAVEHLHTDTVIVMGHTGCGAVNAALHGEFEGAVGLITRRIKEAIGDEKEPSKACELNVRKSVATLREKLDKPDLTVIGSIYDIVSGEVKFLSE